MGEHEGDRPTGAGAVDHHATEVVAAFPLGGVLLPGQLLALSVFEPRYRVMLFDLRDDDPVEFLVTLIERGSEVGGGEARTDVGCIARVASQRDLGGGHTHLEIVGTARAPVLEWLPDDPYPLAVIRRRDTATDHGQVAGRAADPGPQHPSEPDAILLDRAITSYTDLMRATGAMRDTDPIGDTAPKRVGPHGTDPDPDRIRAWRSDPIDATWQLALSAPLATLDRFQLLAEHDPTRRLEMLCTMLADAHALARLWTEPPPGDG